MGQCPSKTNNKTGNRKNNTQVQSQEAPQIEVTVAAAPQKNNRNVKKINNKSASQETPQVEVTVASTAVPAGNVKKANNKTPGVEAAPAGNVKKANNQTPAPDAPVGNVKKANNQTPAPSAPAGNVKKANNQTPAPAAAPAGNVKKANNQTPAPAAPAGNVKKANNQTAPAAAPAGNVKKTNNKTPGVEAATTAVAVTAAAAAAPNVKATLANINKVINSIPNGPPEEFKSLFEGIVAQIPPEAPVNKGKLLDSSKVYEDLVSKFKPQLKEAVKKVPADKIDTLVPLIKSGNIMGILKFLKEQPEVKPEYDKLIQTTTDSMADFISKAGPPMTSAITKPLITPIIKQVISQVGGGRKLRIRKSRSFKPKSTRKTKRVYRKRAKKY